MSERMWISEQLEQARTERDHALLAIAAKDAETERALAVRDAEIARLTAIRDECMGLITSQEREILQLKCDNRLAISARDYANDMLKKGRAEITQLEELAAGAAPAVEDQQPLEPNAEASLLLMECADFFAATFATADVRAWEALLTYLPAHAINDESHPRFIAGYDAGMNDRRLEAKKAAEAMRAKCEAIARAAAEKRLSVIGWNAICDVADAIAALKGK
jgi:hypothetical protein